MDDKDTERELAQARLELKRYKEAEAGRKIVTTLFSLLPCALFIFLFGLCLAAGAFGLYYSCICYQAGDVDAASLWSHIDILGLICMGVVGAFFGWYLTKD